MVDLGKRLKDLLIVNFPLNTKNKRQYILPLVIINSYFIL